MSEKKKKFYPQIQGVTYMYRYLRTQVKSIHDEKSMTVMKVEIAPKLRAGELRLNGGKRNRLKGENAI